MFTATSISTSKTLNREWLSYPRTPTPLATNQHQHHYNQSPKNEKKTKYQRNRTSAPILTFLNFPATHTIAHTPSSIKPTAQLSQRTTPESLVQTTDPPTHPPTLRHWPNPKVPKPHDLFPYPHKLPTTNTAKTPTHAPAKNLRSYGPPERHTTPVQPSPASHAELIHGATRPITPNARKLLFAARYTKLTQSALRNPYHTIPYHDLTMT
ncbi:hypothetical protein J1614_006611 [Plenodomus biglobosus]|nr:hypothetical protein J1614_006611 [Plenodomus biglobosus]